MSWHVVVWGFGASVALVGYEIHQYRSDFDSFTAYVHASGNQVRQHRTLLQLTARH